MEQLFPYAMCIAGGLIFGGLIVWRVSKLKPATRAEALKAVHALYAEAMKLPGAAEAKAEADALAVMEKLAADQFAATITKVAGGS